MSQDFRPGDFLIFQLEAGYGLLRILAIDGDGDDRTWHLSAYEDLFMDTDSADRALQTPSSLTVSHPHLALTTRAFQSTQVARMLNQPLTESEERQVTQWLSAPGHEVSDRSVRLLLGLR